MIQKGGLNARCGLEGVRVHTLKHKDESVGRGGTGSQEVDVSFYTYQRLSLASHPHCRPPMVCKCVCVCPPGKPTIDTQLSTVLIQGLQGGGGDHCASQHPKSSDGRHVCRRRDKSKQRDPARSLFFFIFFLTRTVV